MVFALFFADSERSPIPHALYLLQRPLTALAKLLGCLCPPIPTWALVRQ